MPPQPELVTSEKLIEAPLHVSLAVATPVALVRVSAGQLSVTLPGQVMLGGLVSWTVIVWTHVARLVQASAAVQVRRIV